MLVARSADFEIQLELAREETLLNQGRQKSTKEAGLVVTEKDISRSESALGVMAAMEQLMSG